MEDENGLTKPGARPRRGLGVDVASPAPTPSRRAAERESGPAGSLPSRWLHVHICVNNKTARCPWPAGVLTAAPPLAQCNLQALGTQHLYLAGVHWGHLPEKQRRKKSLPSAELTV